MLVNKFSNISTTNVPNFDASQKVNNLCKRILIENVSPFLAELSTSNFTKNLDECIFTQELIIAISRNLVNSPQGVIVIPEFRDYYTIGGNPVKRVDFAFVSSEQGAIKNSLYSVEAKRLPTGSGKREIEYTIGYFDSGEPSGGIQRFKTGDHGYGLSQSAIIGYVEKNDFTHWHTTINGWIVNKATELPLEWSIDEQLQSLSVSSCQTFSVSHSIARRASDTIELLHLWVKIPSDNNSYIKQSQKRK